MSSFQSPAGGPRRQRKPSRLSHHLLHSAPLTSHHWGVCRHVLSPLPTDKPGLPTTDGSLPTHPLLVTVESDASAYWTHQTPVPRGQKTLEVGTLRRQGLPLWGSVHFF